ncbi:hypothetical protein QA601_07760 [Chitinispirillales bacterium ANBcel5]|uniref:hypothetical protein n=1 Tax=Cellulosispirillum alkaliphilum TaxID=3039283 RepID=UPI002A57E3DE|nr:hypothetical protein [Chitinispirillales bacterium ANBcel5]
MSLEYVKHDKLFLKSHPILNERWLQGIIADDPAILGLGDLALKDVERSTVYGRLDLLLKDDETDTRYVVEIQLGKVDESHIIRTIEYWDEERNRYPQYDHIAVIIAEDITSRFLNVISLFNKAIPIIAIQLNALQIDGKVVLNFAKVMDLAQRPDDEVEEKAEPTDREFWLKKSSREVLETMDKCITLLQTDNPVYRENYNKRYVGIKDDYKSNNKVIFYPKKKHLRIGSKHTNREFWLDQLEEAGITVFREKKSKRVHFRINQEELENNRDLMLSLFKDAYSYETEVE